MDLTWKVLGLALDFIGLRLELGLRGCLVGLEPGRRGCLVGLGHGSIHRQAEINKEYP